MGFYLPFACVGCVVFVLLLCDVFVGCVVLGSGLFIGWLGWFFFSGGTFVWFTWEEERAEMTKPDLTGKKKEKEKLLNSI